MAEENPELFKPGDVVFLRSPEEVCRVTGDPEELAKYREFHRYLSKIFGTGALKVINVDAVIPQDDDPLPHPQLVRIRVMDGPLSREDPDQLSGAWLKKRRFN